MDVHSGIADLNDARLFYETAGSGPAVLLIHGFALDSRIWDAQFEAFASSRHRVVRFDLRGFGRSSMPTTEPYDHSHDIKGLLDYLEIDQASVVGGAMGGGLALNFALTYPQATRVLVCAGGSLWGRAGSNEFDEAQELLLAKCQESGVEAAREYFLQAPLLRGTMRNLSAVQAGRFRQIVQDYSGWHWGHPDPQTAPEPPAAGRLNEITAPSLIMVGEFDRPEFHDLAAILVQGLPKARKHVCTGCGHFPNLERQGPFNHAVLAFLEENRKYLLSR